MDGWGRRTASLRSTPNIGILVAECQEALGTNRSASLADSWTVVSRENSAAVDFDIFFSISQTPVRGRVPSEAEMLRNFFEQVRAADELGFGTAWIAESHLSSEVQKRNRNPVIPHWKGEVGLNADFLQLSHRVFRETTRIETGSAVMNILTNGGPIAAAERVAVFCALHGLDEGEGRHINVGFAAGRFAFMNPPAGLGPRPPPRGGPRAPGEGGGFSGGAGGLCGGARGGAPPG